jgi:hypothetical protein
VEPIALDRRGGAGQQSEGCRGFTAVSQCAP